MTDKQPIEEKATETTPMNPSTESHAVPRIVIEESEPNSDDPPAYSMIVPPNHLSWPFDFSLGIPYSTCTGCSPETQLASFQGSSLTASSGFHLEGPPAQHTSIMMPLMPCQFFKFGSGRSLFVQRPYAISDPGPTTKDSYGRTRRYGALLAAAAVILFLMVLSLLVRFVVEGKFWRG